MALVREEQGEWPFSAHVETETRVAGRRGAWRRGEGKGGESGGVHLNKTEHDDLLFGRVHTGDRTMSYGTR